MKKAFPAFLTVFLMSLCMIFCAANVSAAEVIANAECGDYTAWAVYDNGTMKIDGRGEVDEFPIYMFMDEDVRLSVTSLVVGEGVTRVAGLNDFTYLTSVSLPSTLTVVGESAFEGCESLKSITIPSGFVDNMPVGVNITGRVKEDSVVLNIANKLESSMEYVNQVAKEVE